HRKWSLSRRCRYFGRLGRDVVSPALAAHFSILHSVVVMPTSVRTDARIYNNFIDGASLPSRSGKVFESRKPADRDDLIGYFHESSVADAEAAISAAGRAYARWRLVPAPKRAEILFRAAALMVERKEQFARDMTREMGKVLEETRGDVQEAIDMSFFMAG